MGKSVEEFLVGDVRHLSLVMSFEVGHMEKLAAQNLKMPLG